MTDKQVGNDPPKELGRARFSKSDIFPFIGSTQAWDSGVGRARSDFQTESAISSLINYFSFDDLPRLGASRSPQSFSSSAAIKFSTSRRFITALQ